MEGEWVGWFDGLRRRRIALFIKGGICDLLRGEIVLPFFLSHFVRAWHLGESIMAMDVWINERRLVSFKSNVGEGCMLDLFIKSLLYV